MLSGGTADTQYRPVHDEQRVQDAQPSRIEERRAEFWVEEEHQRARAIGDEAPSPVPQATRAAGAGMMKGEPDRHHAEPEGDRDRQENRSGDVEERKQMQGRPAFDSTAFPRYGQCNVMIRIGKSIRIPRSRAQALARMAVRTSCSFAPSFARMRGRNCGCLRRM